jgi:hypothetical protein
MPNVRVPLEQTFNGFAVSVTNNAAPISNLDLTNLVSSFFISNPSTNTNSVWIGDSNVSINTGLEITAGSGPQFFAIEDQRQLYELQNPLIKIYEGEACQAYPNPDFIPLVVWNPQHWFIITNVAGPVVVTFMPFRNVYM